MVTAGNFLQKLIFSGLIVSLLILSACSSGGEMPTDSTAVISTELPSPVVLTTRIPEPEITGRAFLEAWKAEDYTEMYNHLSSASQLSTSLEQFTQKYITVADEAALGNIETQILNTTKIDQKHAKIFFKVLLDSNVVGLIERDTQMDLEFENGAWRVSYDDGMILPELTGGNTLRMDLNPLQREAIYDRNGNPLAIQSDAVSIGLYPDAVDPEQADSLYGLLSRASGLSAQAIADLVDNANPGDYIPLGQLAADEAPGLISALSTWGAVSLTNYNSRYYPGNGVAPHLVGYVSQIDQGEVSEMRRSGYRVDEKVGRKGIEKWGEDYLVGKHGGTLYVVDPTGQPITEIGSVTSEPGAAIYSTIDKEFQAAVQNALQDFKAAAVVVEVDTGKVLAMASSPGFDPNAFQTENYNWYQTLSGMANNPDLPEFNRSSQGLYPLGSVFKIITLAAALESGLYPPEYTYDCQYEFNEIQGLTLYDWTYTRFQEDGQTPPSGLLTLPEGLVRSCNPFFWHFGVGLFNAGKTTAVADMARGFGLGSPTGIEVVDEDQGRIINPTNVVDAANQAVGQGDTQVTPLQVATFLAAIANGGTLYTPQAIEKIVDLAGNTIFEWSPKKSGELPVTSENLAVIQDAMRGVITS